MDKYDCLYGKPKNVMEMNGNYDLIMQNRNIISKKLPGTSY